MLIPTLLKKTKANSSLESAGLKKLSRGKGHERTRAEFSHLLGINKKPGFLFVHDLG